MVTNEKQFDPKDQLFLLSFTECSRPPERAGIPKPDCLLETHLYFYSNYFVLPQQIYKNITFISAGDIIYSKYFIKLF